MCGYSTDGNQTPGCSPSNDQHNVYFGSKLIEANWALVVTDRLGNVRARSGGNGYTLMSYFPYGEERTVTPDGVDKFGTYFRDGPGQDYAQQRYYSNETGRFWSVDPGGMATADASTPTSLNRYAYVNGDPVNYGDPSGRILVYAGGGLVLNCGGDASSIYDGSCTGTDGGWGGGDVGGGGNLCSSYQDMFLGMPVPPGCDTIVTTGILPPPPPTCTLEVESRPLGYRVLKNSGIDLHGFLVYTGPDGTSQVIEGLHQGKLLTATTDGKPASGTDDGSITGPSVCAALAILRVDVNQIIGAKITYGGLGPNSSSVLHYVLQSLSYLILTNGGLWYSIPTSMLLTGYYVSLPGV
jgi:RHS repeat-associated protein